MNAKRVFLDIHAIQTLPPSNINRDDAGSPKTAMYGGVKRARVSSQAWKRAMRLYFEENSAAELGIRTKRAAEYIAEQMMALDDSITEKDARDAAVKVLNDAEIKTDKNGLTKALFFLGKQQAVRLAQAALEKNSDKKQLKEILRDAPEIDIALFGRMVADDPSLNEDASAQVAHALSTHAVQTEFDYYTAVDDRKSEDTSGAGMIGTIEFNSSTLYRYANVAVHELAAQLGERDAAVSAVKLFVEAFSNSLPSGKMNTFANQSLPQALMVNVRGDRPVSLVGAYEEPVRSSGGYEKESVARMFDALAASEKFVREPLFTLCLVQKEMQGVVPGREEGSLPALLDDLGKMLEQQL